MTRLDEFLLADKQQTDFLSFCNAIGWDCKGLFAGQLTLCELEANNAEELVAGYKSMIRAIFYGEDFTLQDGKQFETPVHMYIEVLLVLTFKQNVAVIADAPEMAYFFGLIRSNVREAVIQNVGESDKELINKWIKD